MNMEEDGETSLVVLVVDFNDTAWLKRTKRLRSIGGDAESSTGMLGIAEVLDAVQMFLHSVLMIHSENDVAVYGALPDGSCRLLYPDHRAQTKLVELKQVHYKVTKRFKLSCRATSNIVDVDVEYKSSLAASLSCALCYCSRIANKYEKANFGNKSLIPKARILVLNVSEEDPSQYITTLNAAFAAQKVQVPVDVCDFSLNGSSLLQQVAHLSNGLWINPGLNSSASLIQLLWQVFLPDLNTRKKLNLPSAAPIICQAACFCHKKMIDRGYVCSVCLSVFCEPALKCATCGNRVRVN